MAQTVHRRRLITGIFLTGLVPLVAVGSVATAAPSASRNDAAAGPHGITVTLLSRGTMAKPFEVEASGVELQARQVIDVATVRVDLQPGGTTGWHVHPGPAVATVAAGRLTLIGKDCTRHTYTAGQSFTEKGPGDSNKALNNSDTNTQVVVTFFVPTGANPLLITVPAPACAGSS